MRQAITRATSVWFGWTMPRGLATSTTVERERLRKAHILSIGVFSAVLFSLPLLTLSFIAPTHAAVIILVVFEGIQLLSTVLNRRGQVEYACLIFILGYMVTTIWGLANQTPASGVVPLWGWGQMVIPTVFAGLLLPFWTPIIFAIIDSLIVTLFIEAHAADTFGLHLLSPIARVAYFVYQYIIMGAIAVICMVSAYSVERAVADSDRSNELEEAHAALELAHADLASAYGQLESLATTDATTGLLNHRALDTRLGMEVERTKRTGEPFAIIFADLDHFKQVNDTWGHQAGDSVLAHLANAFKKHLRTVDIVARYGGEEFVIVLPGQNHEQGIQSAERLRLIVAESQVILPDDQQLMITVSMGVAIYPLDGTTVEALMVAADLAMYRAKHAGRNCVCSALDAPDDAQGARPAA